MATLKTLQVSSIHVRAGRHIAFTSRTRLEIDHHYLQPPYSHEVRVSLIEGLLYIHVTKFVNRLFWVFGPEIFARVNQGIAARGVFTPLLNVETGCTS